MPKRTKAIKISDIKGKKPWLKKVNPSIYQVDAIELNKLVLIVCEGQTEKLYFESFPVLGLDVEAINLEGQTKLKLIESTTQIIEDSEKDYDEIWCVFDMDVRKGEKEYSDFDNAISKGKTKGFKVAYSNDSFELWFYLHYHLTKQQNHRSFYNKQLGKKWNINYDKEGKKWAFCLRIYNILENDPIASQEKAIDRAEKIFKEQSNLKYHQQNPVTLVYKLVEFLNRNKRE